jgi:hypothetical protein
MFWVQTQVFLFITIPGPYMVWFGSHLGKPDPLTSLEIGCPWIDQFEDYGLDKLFYVISNTIWIWIEFRPEEQKESHVHEVSD